VRVHRRLAGNDLQVRTGHGEDLRKAQCRCSTTCDQAACETSIDGKVSKGLAANCAGETDDMVICLNDNAQICSGLTVAQACADQAAAYKTCTGTAW
jgi:hypothetical protein